MARLGVTACAEVATCRNRVVEKGLGALLGIGAAKTALDNLSSSERDYVFSVAMSGKADLIERLTPEQRAAYNYMVGQDQKGLITVFPKPDRELTDGKLINPGHSDQQGLVNTGNNQPLASGPTHTGNSDGLVNTGGTSTVTPLPDGPSKDDLVYLAEKPLGLGSTGRTEPNSLQEKLAIDQAISNPTAGLQLPVPMTDKRWPREDGWVKMSQNINGVEIHYVRNTKTGQIDDFKFKWV